MKINTLKLLCCFLILGIYSLTIAQNDTRMFIFGNSTIDHEFQVIPTPSDETKVPHWFYLLSQEAGYTYSAGGQYGFLPQFANLNFIAQWGYDLVPGVWDSDNEPFSDADINTVLITGANFIQWQPPYVEYPSDPGITPLSATEDVMDWVMLQGDDPNIYIYENWPDMAPYLGSGFPPNSSEFATYNDYTLNDFHDWWLEYQDSLLIARPAINVRMIPIGPIIAELVTTGPLNQTPITELYEDDAPHGRATVYFLAGLITYMAIHEEEAPSTYSVPSIIHADVQNNYATIVSEIWTYLQNFNDDNGDSRVFFETDITNGTDVLLDQNSITVYPNPTLGYFQIEGTLANYQIEILDSMGNTVQNLNSTGNSLTIDISSLSAGLYFIQIIHNNNGILSIQKILKEN